MRQFGAYYIALLLAGVSLCSGCCSADGQSNGKRTLWPGFTCGFWDSIRLPLPQLGKGRRGRLREDCGAPSIPPEAQFEAQFGLPQRPPANEQATIVPPHSRFHPVPTQNAFAQRDHYSPPEPILEESPSPEGTQPPLWLHHRDIIELPPESTMETVLPPHETLTPQQDGAPLLLPQDARPLQIPEDIPPELPEGPESNSFFKELTPSAPIKQKAPAAPQPSSPEVKAPSPKADDPPSLPKDATIPPASDDTPKPSDGAQYNGGATEENLPEPPRPTHELWFTVYWQR